MQLHILEDGDEKIEDFAALVRLEPRDKLRDRIEQRVNVLLPCCHVPALYQPRAMNAGMERGSGRASRLLARTIPDRWCLEIAHDRSGDNLILRIK